MHNFYQEPALQALQPNVVIESFVLVTKDGLNTQAIRSNQMSMTQNDLQSIQDTVLKGGGINPIQIANNTSGVFKQTNSMPIISALDGGWNQTRYSFKLVIRVDEHDTQKRIIFSGWSDYCDETAGNLEPRTVFYINSINTTSFSRDMVTGMVSPFTSSNVNLCYNTTLGTQNILATDVGGALVTNRPIDLLTANSAEVEVAGAVDMTRILTNNPITTSRTNTVGAIAATKLINNLVDAVAVGGFGGGDNNNVLDMAITQTYDIDGLNNPFFTAVFNKTGHRITNAFTAEMLMTFDPQLFSHNDTRMVKQMSGAEILQAQQYAQNLNSQTLSTEVFDSNVGTSIEASIASSIFDSISAIMTENQVTDLMWTIHNHPKGQGDLDPSPYTTGPVLGHVYGTNQNDPTGASQQKELMALHTVCNAFKTIAFPSLVPEGNWLSVSIEARNEVNTKIAIGLNGAEPIPFVFPSNMSTMFSPIISTTDVANELALGVKQFTNMLGV